MENIKVKIKRLSKDSKIPQYAHYTDAGMDLYATSVEYDSHSEIVSYNTGIALEIPEGYVGLIFPRSSIYKYDLQLTNSVGVIDSSYRGEIKFKFRSTDAPISRLTSLYNVGDRIGQLIIMPYPKVTLEEVDELQSTDRGDGGFGSTGVK